MLEKIKFARFENTNNAYKRNQNERELGIFIVSFLIRSEELNKYWSTPILINIHTVTMVGW